MKINHKISNQEIYKLILDNPLELIIKEMKSIRLISILIKRMQRIFKIFKEGTNNFRDRLLLGKFKEVLGKMMVLI